MPLWGPWLAGDGDMDLFVANAFAANELLVNNGAGHFTATLDSAATSAPPEGVLTYGAVAFSASRGRDAAPGVDLLVLNGRLHTSTADDQGNELLINEGGSLWQAVTGTALVTTPGKSLDAVAFDADGKFGPDLYIGNNEGTNELYLSDGNGGWTAVEPSLSNAAVRPTDDSTFAVTALDANGDGFMDLFLANCEAANELLINDGTG
eukprot:7485045-Pyramimonas_sp.AAC.4